MKKDWSFYKSTDDVDIRRIVVDNCETNYYATSDGHIVSSNYRRSGKPCILKENINKDGYHTVKLYVNGKKKTCKVHRLVASAFIPNPLNLSEVNHIRVENSENKSDNSVSNLEWCDRKHNMQHAVKNGLHKALKGENHQSVVYTDKQIHAVCKHLEKGKLTIKQISDKTGVSRYTIGKILDPRKSVRKDVTKLYNFANYRGAIIYGNSLRRYSDKQIKDVCKELVKGGIPMYKISEKTGVSYAVVKKIRARKHKSYERIYSKYDF